jgi:hypothetical protein
VIVKVTFNWTEVLKAAWLELGDVRISVGVGVGLNRHVELKKLCQFKPSVMGKIFFHLRLYYNVQSSTSVHQTGLVEISNFQPFEALCP